MSLENAKARKPEHELFHGFRVFVLSCLTVGVMNAQTPPEPRTIEKGDQSNVEDAKQVLARSGAELRVLWQQHAPDRPAPSIDFSKEMVVAVFMGSRPNAGFSTAIVSATAAAGVLIVRYSETRPKPGAIAAQVLTFPYHIVAIPKADVRDVKFEKVE
jgi:hypothetical protein